jgi:hypothetical protein
MAVSMVCLYQDFSKFHKGKFAFNRPRQHSELFKVFELSADSVTEMLKMCNKKECRCAAIVKLKEEYTDELELIAFVREQVQLRKCQMLIGDDDE